MPYDSIFSEEEIDYLREMVNIGSGHAASALSQMLRQRIVVNMPKLYLSPARRVPSILGDRSLPIVGVKMNLVGDVRGEAFFVIPESDKARIIGMAEKAALGHARMGAPDVSVLEEMANIIAGAYLTAIHDFCKLNIYHSVPVAATDAFQALIDELLADASRQAAALVVIQNEFAIVVESEIASADRLIRTYFIVLPAPESSRALADSIRNARPR